MIGNLRQFALHRTLRDISEFDTERFILNQTSIIGSKLSLIDVTYLGGQIPSLTRHRKCGFTKIRIYNYLNVLD